MNDEISDDFIARMKEYDDECHRRFCELLEADKRLFQRNMIGVGIIASLFSIAYYNYATTLH